MGGSSQPGRRRRWCASVRSSKRISARNGWIVLKIRSLSVAYGGLQALSGVSLDVEQGEFVAVVGPNGAGKTTLFKAISGVVEPLGGEISYKGMNLFSLPPSGPARPGIPHVPEGRQVF